VSEKLFGESPWKSILLPEPVPVEAGKHYEIGIGAEGVPYVKEIPSGGLTFERAATITAVHIYSVGTMAA